MKPEETNITIKKPKKKNNKENASPPSETSPNLDTSHDTELIKTTLDLPKNWHLNFKLYSIKKGKTMKDIIISAVNKEMEENP